ncbi:MAG TPA: hypothetical protein VES88_08755 [Gemmatimonadaceae bacterium]|nr:hypothetical protein [Gemmatimonadaceae bacterium]
MIPPLVFVAAACVACSRDAAVARRSTQRERDSVVSTLPIPGASVVGKALTVSDSAASRASLMDSASQD